MTQLTRHRRKKRRFYWVELGFLLLGLIGLRPEILTELLPHHQNHYVPVPSPQTFLQPIYQVPEQQTHGYSYPAYYNHPQGQLAYNPGYQTASYPVANYPPASYPPATYLPANNYPPTQPRLASNPALNPSEVTSRYSTNPGYAYGSTSSNNSTPPVVWPEGYQPSSYPSNGPNVYRR
jgi:hypothetical protein